MSAWRGSRRSAELPPDWPARRERCKQRAGGRCEALSQITDWGKVYNVGTRCTRPGTDADHRSDRTNHDDLQWLCGPHHKRKTAQEARAGRERRKLPKRQGEPHPGRLR